MSRFEDTQRLAQTMVRKQRTRDKKEKTPSGFLRGRFIFMVTILAVLTCSVLVMAAYIQMISSDFLRDQGDARSVRLSKLEAPRASITDRNGEELAISIPSESLWVDPVQVLSSLGEYPGLFKSEGWKQLSELAGMKQEVLVDWINNRSKKRFVYLKRHLNQNQANVIKALKLPGIHLLAEPRRFYPAAEVAAHVTGFTNTSGKGLEGFERTFDKWLSGEPGQVLVRRDLLGNVIERKKVLKAPESGHEVALSLDARIQTIAYVELKKVFQHVKADSATVVVLDVQSGEVLAMVNQPSFNPNNRVSLDVNAVRNRAATDVFEPGSTLKPFTALAALQSGQYLPNTMIDTNAIKLNGYWVGRAHNYGLLSVSDVIKKSSNVGVSKMALSLPTDDFLNMFYQLGFGTDTGSGFPGESMGVFREKRRWSDIEKATLSYGYGISVTALQLARAYAVLGSGGVIRPVTFLRQDEVVVGERLFSKSITKKILLMMEKVVEKGGTGTRASIEGYRVAGKTGTAIKSNSGGYGDDYVAIFAGVAPLTNPKLAIVVMVDNPKGDEYYGGDLAAPIFSNIMERSLRWLDVSPDKIELPMMIANSLPVKSSSLNSSSLNNSLVNREGGSRR